MKNRRKIIRLINKIKRETRRRNIIWEECESLEYDDERSEQCNELVHRFCGHTNKGIIFHIMYLIGASGDIWQLYIEEIVPDICIPAQLLYSTDDPRSASLKHVSESLSKEIISSINDVSMPLSMHDTVNRYLADEVIAYE